MVDGDIRLDDELELEDGTRVVMFAVDNSDYPGGVNYRMAYFDPEAGEEILRYDNSQEPRHGVDVHHRHRGDGVSEIPFRGLKDHVSRFQSEVTKLHDKRT